LSVADALARLKDGRPDAAVSLLKSHLGTHPTDARAWFLLGASHHALKQLGDAAPALSRSIALDPSHLESHLALIAVLRDKGEFDRALVACRQASARFPASPRVLYATALCYEDLNKFDAALAHYDAALAEDPALDDALHNRGLLLIRMGKLEDAERHLRRYAASNPQAARAQDVLADLLFMRGGMDEALETLKRAERIAPGRLLTRIREGAALACLARFDEARDKFQTARELDPKAVASYVQRIAPGSDPAFTLSPENLHLTLCWLQLGRCDWAHWDSGIAGLRRVAANPDIRIEPAATFMSLHLPLDARDRLAVARHVAAQIESVYAPLAVRARRPKPRLRVGVLSPDLREHLNGYLLLPLFELLDRRRFELHAYSLSGEDGSAIRARLQASADRFQELQGMPDADAAAAIRNDEIDIFLDVGGHTTGGRFAITALRPAHIQALYLGFPGSLGSSRIDFAIADQVAAGDPSEWAETLVYLPHTYFLYDFRQPTPQDCGKRNEYGLCESSFVYCAFHKAEKVSPDTFRLWMQILSQVPSSVLWLLSLPVEAQRNLRREAEECHVDPDRLVFAPFDPRDRYLARQRLGDLMLDAIHHSAMTTACDAMAAGLPVLTIPGNAMASRAGESLARAAGVPEMVARDKDDYVEKAVFLARHPQELRRIRQKLLARKGLLFDTPGRVRELEQAFLEMWRRYNQRR